jgi:NADH:ubiquinone oxidoreductase subunit K
MNLDYYISFKDYMDVAITLAMIGILGILSNRKHLLIALISIELMFYGLNITFLMVSLNIDDIKGEISSIFVLIIAGADSALALALITAYFKRRRTIEGLDLSLLDKEQIEEKKKEEEYEY